MKLLYCAGHKKVKTLKPDVGDIELVEGVIRYFDFKDTMGNRLSFYQLISEDHE